MIEKNKNIVFTVVFSLFLFGGFIVNVFKKDTVISISERRRLEQMPEFSFKTLFDGTFFQKFDSYTTDQFVMRDNFRLLKANLELGIKHNYNDLYVYNDYIIKQLYPLSESSVLNLIDKINFIKNNYLGDNKIYFSIVPDKNYFVSNGNLRLDYEKMESIMKSNLEDAHYINIFDLLSLDNYYKTDTHWKQETLIDVSKKMANEMDFIVDDNYEIKRVTDFLGVYAGQLPIKSNEEEINVLINDSIRNSRVYNYEDNKITSVYDLDKIRAIDKYDIYLSGAVSLINIINDKIDSDRELIVFRDSYGSSLIPLFTSGYKSIVVVDTRYISPKILKQFIEFNNQDVLFLYSTLLINDSLSLK